LEPATPTVYCIGLHFVDHLGLRLAAAEGCNCHDRSEGSGPAFHDDSLVIVAPAAFWDALHITNLAQAAPAVLGGPKHTRRDARVLDTSAVGDTRRAVTPGRSRGKKVLSRVDHNNKTKGQSRQPRRLPAGVSLASDEKRAELARRCGPARESN